MQQLRRLAFFERLLVQPQLGSSSNNAAEVFGSAAAAAQQQPLAAAAALSSGGISAVDGDTRRSTAAALPEAASFPFSSASAATRGAAAAAVGDSPYAGGTSSATAAAAAGGGGGGQFVCGAGTPTQLWLCEEGGVCYILDEALRSLLLPVFSFQFLAIHSAEAAGCMICIGRDRVVEGPSASRGGGGAAAGAAGAGAAAAASTAAGSSATKTKMAGFPVSASSSTSVGGSLSSSSFSSAAASSSSFSSASSSSSAAASGRPLLPATVLKYKCFSCTQVDPAKKKPLLLREAPVFTSLPEQQLTCTDVSSSFSMLALGTHRTGVYLFRGDLLREKTCRLRLLRQEGAAPVTAVCFLKRRDAAAAEGAAGEELPREYLFVATLHTMLCYSIPLKGEPQITFQDDHGGLSSPLLACRLNAWRKVAVQRGDGIFCLDAEQGRLWAMPCEEEESYTMLAAYKHYLIAVAQEKQDGPNTTAAAAATPGIQPPFQLAAAEEPAAGRQQQHQQPQFDSAPPRRVQQNFLTIYRMSTEARFVAYSCAVPEVLLVVPALESLFVVCSGVGGRGSSSQRPRHVFFELREKSFNDRINILLRKRLFDWAADLVVQELQPQPVLQEVYRLHADWLYAKGQYDAAIRMHVKTIGCVEPSYVIEKYLTCQRLDLLAQYLLQLHRHRRGAAQQQHTLLFFKCAAQLKDEQLLQAFLSDACIRQKDVLLPAVIHECRSNGYTQLAGSIAARQGLHDEVVAILLDDYADFEGAMEYLKRLDTPAACALLLTHGHVLLSHKPKEALQLMQMLVEQFHVNADIFVPLFLDLEPLLLYFLSSLLFSAAVAEEVLLLLQRLLLLPPAQALAERDSQGEKSNGEDQQQQQRRMHQPVSGCAAASASAPAPQQQKEAALEKTRSQQQQEEEEEQQSPPLQSLRLLLAAIAADTSAAAAPTSATRGTPLQQAGASLADSDAAAASGAAASAASSHSSSSPPLYGKVSFLTCLELLLRFRRKARARKMIPAAKGGQQQQEKELGSCSSSDSGSSTEGTAKGGGKGEEGGGRAASAAAEGGAGRRDSRSSRHVDAGGGGEEAAAAAAFFARLAMRALREHPMSEEELFGVTVLCTLYDFSEGQLFACEQRRDFQLPLSCLTSSDQLQQIFSLCCSHAATSPSVWLQALAVFATQPRKELVIRGILSHMEQSHQLFSPLVILNVLRQRGSTVTLGAIKEYFLQAFEKLNAEVEASTSRLAEDQGSIKKMEAEMHALAFSGQVFDKSRCDSCEQPLELPSVHISCGHSFHLYCVAETVGKGETTAPLVLLPSAADTLLLTGGGVGGGAADYAVAAGGGGATPRYCCPLCSPEAEAKRLLLAQRQGERGNWEDFFKFLRVADDGFSFVASYFGKEMFLPDEDQVTLQPSFPSARFHALAGLVPPEEAKFTRLSSRLQQRFASRLHSYIHLASQQSLPSSDHSTSTSSAFSSLGREVPGRFSDDTAALSHGSSTGKRQLPLIRAAGYDRGNPATVSSASHTCATPTASVSTNPFEPASPRASLSTLPTSSMQSTNPF